MKVLAKMRSIPVCECGFAPDELIIALFNAKAHIVADTDKVEDREYRCEECKRDTVIRMMTIILTMPTSSLRVEQWWPLIALELDEAPYEASSVR